MRAFKLSWALVALGLVAEASPATAADRVEFSADHAELDPERGRLSLGGRVRARCGAYSLRADSLQIQTSPEEIDVRGPATVVLCPCSQGEVSVAFERAKLRPPSDLVLSAPKLRIGDTTVFALPSAWLRGADQVGLLVPRVAWRGAEGLLVGPGVHLPWRESSGDLASMDVYISGYTQGGAELFSTISTGRSRTSVRLDHLRGNLASVQSQGAAGEGAVLSWSADLARGDRVPEALIDLGSAARRYDQVRGQLAYRATNSLVLATGLEAWGGRTLQGNLALGPLASASAGGLIDRAGVWDLGLSTRVLSEPGSGAAQVSRAVAGAELHHALGNVLVSWQTRGSATALLIDSKDAADLSATTSLRGALPLSRTYGRGIDAKLHVIEPFAQSSLLAARTSGEALAAADRPAALASGQRWIASAGLRTALGRAAGSEGQEAEVSVGAVGPFEQATPSAAMLGAVRANRTLFGLQLSGAAVREQAKHQGLVLARMRLGLATGSQLLLRVAHRGELDASTARALGWGQPFAIGASWLDRAGTSLGADAVAPLGRGYRLFIGGDGDAQERELVATRGGLGYLHPCGCLSATAWAGHRLGRDGVDAWIALDLAPR